MPRMQPNGLALIRTPTATFDSKTMTIQTKKENESSRSK